MSEIAQREWQVRPARQDDVAEIVTAVRELLLELDGAPPAAAAMHDATRALLEDEGAGALLVAETDDGTLAGVLAASWQIAIHVPGRYALIQDLWVHPSWRSKAIGAGLIAALLELARSRGVERIEVGLPLESFSRFDATEAFYLDNGFTPNGPRMKRLLS
jgi:GNAT superfamily N-acetyltransferase